MNFFRHSPIGFLLITLLSGCGTPHGKPARSAEVQEPDQIMDFATLYSQNCAGCHGPNGTGGAAIALADPVYLAIANDATIRNVTANGVPGTQMPAFAQRAGGRLTAKQVDAIADGIRSRWGKQGILDGASVPPYAANAAGDPARGAVVYKADCESCHGPEGRGSAKGSSITHPAFLSLVSDQGLRTVVIAGRPELGAPDWRGDVPGKPMSDREVTDVVAWLVSQRPAMAATSSDSKNAHPQEPIDVR